MGFSGGGQFAHRFFYLYPERLHAVSVGAPGRMTRLDNTLNWPQGIKDVHEKFDRDVDISKLRDFNTLHFVVGEEDNKPHGGEAFWEWLEDFRKANSRKKQDSSTAETKMERIGTRLQMAGNVIEEWKSVGIEAKFDIVPGVAHDSKGVQDVVLSFFKPLVTQAYGGRF